MFVSGVLAQAPTPIYIAPDAPQWVQMMVSEHPNVHAVEAAYQAYYKENTFQKNSYTQYFKRWMRWARPYTQADGSLYFPTPTEVETQQARIQKIRLAKNESESGTGGNWTFVGPNQTYDTYGTTIVTWQTNIYSLDIAPSNANILYAGGETGGIWKTMRIRS